MTTIVYKDGVLAADTRAYAGDPTPIGRKNKIHRTPGGEQYALGALATGCDAVAAVEIAAQLDSWTALPVESLKLNADS